MSSPSTSERAGTSEWSARLNQQKVGPFTLAQLRLLVDAGELRPDDLVLPPGTDQWVPVSAVPELATPRPAAASRPQVTASRTPGSAEPLLWPVAPDEDEPPQRRQPLKSGGGFWRWYRTRPGLVVLLAALLAALALVPILLFMLVLRQQRLQAMMAEKRAMMAEMEARAMAEENRADAEAALRKAQQVLAEPPPRLPEQPEGRPEGPLTALKAKLNVPPLQPAEGDDELRKLLKEQCNAGQAAAKGILARIGVQPPLDLSHLRRAVKKWITAQLELNDKPIDQVAVLEKNLALAQNLEQIANDLWKQGQAARDEVDSMRYYRLDAEIQLLKAKRKLKQPDK